MKKNILLIGLIICLFSSCFKDVPVWDSATLGYSGRYVIKTMDESMTHLGSDYDGSEFYIYNTASNKSNEIWMEDVNRALSPGIKSKFFLTGNEASFKSVEFDFENLTDNLFAIGLPTDTIPEQANLILEQERPYVRCAIAEGKILRKAVTTKGGNTADSLYLKLNLFSGKVKFKSYLLPKEEWTNPNEEEFAWNYESSTYDASQDTVVVVGGYSYTGFVEDLY